MHTISFNKQIYKAPAEWPELTTVDLLQLAIYMSAPADPGYLVMMLFKIPVKQFARIWAKESVKLQLKPLIKWAFAKNTLQNWLIKCVKVHGRKLYGPKHKLADLTIEEFTWCEAAYERWLESQNTDYLDTLFAVLYRKPGFFSLKRATFDADQLDDLQKSAQSVPKYIKRAIAINYAGCRNLIIDKHPYIWPPLDPNAAPAAPAVHRPTNWAQLVLNLSGDKFGTYRQTNSELLWLVLADFNKKAKDFAALETPDQ